MLAEKHFCCVVALMLVTVQPDESLPAAVSCRCFLVLRSPTATSWTPSTAERTRSTWSRSDGYDARAHTHTHTAGSHSCAC